jgi:hypothetical protein
MSTRGKGGALRTLSLPAGPEPMPSNMMALIGLVPEPEPEREPDARPDRVVPLSPAESAPMRPYPRARLPLSANGRRRSRLYTFPARRIHPALGWSLLLPSWARPGGGR